MTKVQLNLEDLRVESFDTLPEEEEDRGTVIGLSGTGDIHVCSYDTICQTCAGPPGCTWTQCY